jgi:hypothetical protein
MIWKSKNNITLKSSNRLEAVESMDDDNDDDDVDISGAWKSITENTKASVTEILCYCELKQHKQ